jgi:hypothetical protein
MTSRCWNLIAAIPIKKGAAAIIPKGLLPQFGAIPLITFEKRLPAFECMELDSHQVLPLRLAGR